MNHRFFFKMTIIFSMKPNFNSGKNITLNSTFISHCKAAAQPPEAPASQPAPSAANVTQTPFGMGSLGGLSGMGNLGVGSVNFMEMQQRMQQEVRLILPVRMPCRSIHMDISKVVWSSGRLR